MNYYRIRGAIPLQGNVQIGGMKNTALAILFATVLVKETCILENVPQISDIHTTVQLLRSMGAKACWKDKDTISIDTSHFIATIPPHSLVCKMRASSYLLGTMLGRFGICHMAYPGGCNFGVRPIDQHLYAFSAFGAKTHSSKEEIFVEGTVLQGADLSFQTVSVGATINALFAAVCAEGITHIFHGAKEPHVCDTADFLNRCGADIRGIGTECITVYGGKELHGCTYRIGPDMIEAGTYLIAALATGGSVSCLNIDPKHLECLTKPLRKMGNDLMIDGKTIVAKRGNVLQGVPVVTEPYPGFPTDLHPQLAVLQALAQTQGSIQETVWNQRFQYLSELEKMGVRYEIHQDTVTLLPSVLHGAEVIAPDLRGGAALLIAALAAKGESKIYHPEPIERGYEDMIGKLQELGADIENIRA